MEAILEGVRVLELTEALAGPYCAMLLGDFGAEVIKVERPGVGDQSRGWGPPFVGEQSAYFLAANRNKRSLTLNYDQPFGAELLQHLLATTDVLLINQPVLESLKKRGIDPTTLCSKFPRLVYCSITGYGFGGPKSGLPGYDIIAQAEAGVMSFTGEPGSGPIRYPIAIADMTCGMYSAMGILAALFAREKTGRGQFLDMALFDSQLTWLANSGSNYLNAGVSPERSGNSHPSIVPYDAFQGSDGRHFVVGVGTEPLWKRFANVMGFEDTIGRDARFQTNALRTKSRAVLIPMVQKIFASKASTEWLQELAKAEIPAAPINTVGEAVNEVQVKARGLIVQMEHPAAGTVRSIANPIHFSATPVTYRMPPPLLGEHTNEILCGLGYSEEQIARAHDEGAV